MIAATVGTTVGSLYRHPSVMSAERSLITRSKVEVYALCAQTSADKRQNAEQVVGERQSAKGSGSGLL
jgi:hypothetical protein